MHKPVLFVLPLLLCLDVLNGQTLYTPRDIRHAYDKGTRSTDGRPGPRYWQNSGRYDISITATPPEPTIRGNESITYFNNSPDTLDVIVIRLICNIHKPGATRLGMEDSSYLTPGVTIDSYAENGRQKPWLNNALDGTWKNVRLTTPLLPHDSVRLNFTWHYAVSRKSNREGMIDPTTFYLAYFYPRVAVYDDYNGWDRMDFTDLQEFYNDFNDYTLHVTVPHNFIVWSTGELQDADSVLAPAYARKLAASMTGDAIVSIATPAEIASGKVTAPNPANTWTWTASDITDMAVGISDHFAWDASSVVVDDATGRRASVQSAYDDTAKDFHRMVEFGRHALDWLSHNWPGVPYPFPKTTLFQGYADMEYPMMVNDNTTPSPLFTRFVAEHEIAHSWFPFYMGINESRYPFMDEGWATTFELLIGRADLGNERAEEAYREFRVNSYTYDPSGEEDLPIITPGDAMKGAGYGNNAYGKPSLAYLAIKDMLGDQLFGKCLRAYMDRWHGKHPVPWDFFYSFNDVSGRNLDWFWKNWFFSNNYLDIAVDKVEQNASGETVVHVRNIGGFAIPFDIVTTFNDGTNTRVHETPAVWEDHASETQITLTAAAGKKPLAIHLDNGIYVDADASNNTWHAK
ncbi:MAG TPA: M1 family metallopeptidase [Puia sp.]|nr:M1 family metallopeptidase [Puia sp.]